MEKAQPVLKRKWTGLVKWLLIANLVWGGFKVLGATPIELITLLPLLICLWGIYRFKRWGFYAMATIRVVDFFICLGAQSYAAEAQAMPYIESIVADVFALTLVALIVRTRWTDMDPVRFPFRGTSTPYGE